MPDIRAKLVYSQEGPWKAANHFHFSRLGGDVQMSVGYIDLHQLAFLGREGEKDPERTEPYDVEVPITDNFFMSARAFAELHSKVNDIFEKMQASGHIKAGQDDD